MNKIIVNNELCTGCRSCFKSCFIDVIHWNEEERRPVIAYPEECVQCMFCEINCPCPGGKGDPGLRGLRLPAGQHHVYVGGPQ